MTHLTQEQRELIKMLEHEIKINKLQWAEWNDVLEIIRLQNLVIEKAVEQRNSMFFKARDYPQQCGDQLVPLSVYAERTDQQLTAIMEGKG